MSIGRFASGLLCISAGLLIGSTSQSFKAFSSSRTSTHNPVQPPPTLKKENSLIWVSLGAHLGKSTLGGGPPTNLILKSAGKPLSLQDASGQIHTASLINFKWLSIPLSKPTKFSRKVIGSFSSFESAERVALKLKKLGFPAVLARPKEWEVWVPKRYRLPKRFDAELIEVSKKSKIQPVLLGSNNAINTQKRFVGPIQIDASDGLIWKGGVYKGTFRLQRDAYGSWTLIAQVPLEKYLEGVVPHEIGASAPFSALKAQAVLARTWALANSHRFLLDGYHLCSDTQCQVYKDPNKASSIVKQAIKASEGKVLLWEGKPINAVYHASNGGVMAAANEAWSIEPLPYLKSQLDGSMEWREKFDLPLSTAVHVLNLLQEREGANGIGHPRFRWTRTMNAIQLKKTLSAIAPSLLHPTQLKVISRGSSGRVLALEIQDGSQKPPLVLRLDAIRRNIPQLPSTLFVIRPAGNGVWNFLGGGFGHGAGLSQAGAIDLAIRGWTTEKILRHYYPKTIYDSLPDFRNSP